MKDSQSVAGSNMPDTSRYPFPEGLYAIVTVTDDPDRYAREYKPTLADAEQKGIFIPKRSYVNPGEALDWVVQQQAPEGVQDPCCVILLDPPGIFSGQDAAKAFFERLHTHNKAVVNRTQGAAGEERSRQYVVIPIVVDSDPKEGNEKFYERQGALYLRANREANLAPETLSGTIKASQNSCFTKAGELRGQPGISNLYRRMSGQWRRAPL